MSAFSGFSEDVFECCERSQKIRVPINALRQLQREIEPEIRKLNSALVWHVSKTKIQGTNRYNDWAWLYYNTIGTGSNKYSQLTVNISPTRVYAGVNIRTAFEYAKLKEEVQKLENMALFEQMLKSLSGRELIIPFDDWEDETPRRYTVEELRGILLDPSLSWINACFARDEPIVKSRKIADEVIQVFRELYNIYALASGNQTIIQPEPKDGVFEQEIIVDNAESTPKTDEEASSEAIEFLSSLKTTSKLGKYHMPRKNDQYNVKRTALEYNLAPNEVNLQGKNVTVYSDKSIIDFQSEILRIYPEFSKLLEQIRELLPLPEDFLKIMFVDPKTDARYHRTEDINSIFLNMARFDKNKNLFFWLFTICRELAYVKKHRLGYPFINQLRDVMTFALDNLQTTAK